MSTTWIIICSAGAAVVIWGIIIYNRLVHLRNVRENAFSNIDIYLRQRYDLVPQLVATVKGYAKHEKTTLENVIRARNQGMKADSIEERIAADREMRRHLIALNAVAEAYPELKADSSFMHLQQTLVEIEERLASVRSFFNMSTREYNDEVEAFPQRVIASLGGFRRECMFTVSEYEREIIETPPVVSFD